MIGIEFKTNSYTKENFSIIPKYIFLTPFFSPEVKFYKTTFHAARKYVIAEMAQCDLRDLDHALLILSKSQRLSH